MFFWARNTQFWQSCRSYSAEIRLFRCSDSEKNEQDCFSGKLFPFKMFPGQEKCSFHKSDRKKSLISVSRPKPLKSRKSRSPWKKILSPNHSSRHRECTFDAPDSKFFPEDKTFFCSKPKVMNNSVDFSAKSFFLKVFAGHEKRKHDNFAEMTSLISDPFSAQSTNSWTKISASNQNNFSSKCSLDRGKAVLTCMPE